MKIGLDVMGGDKAPSVRIEGAILALQELPQQDTNIVLIGNKQIIEQELNKRNIPHNTFHIVDAPDVIEMGETPTKAIVQKPNSSISVGCKLLASGDIDVFAGAGNTGAMMVGAVLMLKTIEKVIRPTILSVIPKPNGSQNVILDVGTNPDCKPEILYQFGILGKIYAQSVLNIPDPKIGLLNIGEEPEKGSLLTQAAYNLMKDSTDYNFIGNVEGRDLLGDKADVIVCDGFTGNVVLKTIESIYYMMKKRNLLDSYFQQFNYELYGGTPILGVNGNVIIGHGISNEMAIKNMLLLARDVVNAQLSKKIKYALNIKEPSSNE